MNIDLGLAVPILCFDVETYPNVTTVAVRDVNAVENRDRVFTNVDGIGETFDALRQLMQAPALWFGFNALSFDNYLMKAIAEGVDDAPTLKTLADSRINSKGRQGLLVDFGGGQVVCDLFAIFKGKFGKIGGLKWVAYKLDATHHSELPFDPNHSLAIPDEVHTLCTYNVLDNAHTEAMLAVTQEQVRIRLTLAERYNLDISRLINASDSRLAEEVLRVGMFGHDGKPVYTRSTDWTISGAEIVDGFDFHDPELIALRDRIATWDLTYHSSETKKNDGDTERKVSRPKYRERFKFAGLTYKLGMGGLHSIDGPGCWEADDNWVILDFDISSFYPMMMRTFNWGPMHLDRDRFQQVLGDLIDQRLAAANAAQRSNSPEEGNNLGLLAQALKVALNSIFGKSKSAYSWLLDPTVTARVCITGEIIILQATEVFAMIEDVQILSVNTDGVMLRCRRSDQSLVQQRMKAFVAAYGMDCKVIEYGKLWRRDGNNYLAVDSKGQIKAKGAYGYDRSNLEKSPTLRVVVDAVQAFFVHETPIGDTIRRERRVTEFLNYFKASRNWSLEGEDGGNLEATMLRWYHAVNGITVYKRKLGETSRTKVVTGVRLLPELPDVLPGDVDYDVYLAAAQKLIDAIINPKAKKASTQIALEHLSAEQREQFRRNAECEVPDLARCDAVDLTKYRLYYDTLAKGTRYDTMTLIAWMIWVDGKGTLTHGDLLELVERVVAGEDYWDQPDNASKIEATVERLAYDCSPFPKPVSSAEILTAAMTWAREHVEMAKRRRTMYHNGIGDSTYITGTTIRNYGTRRDEYKLACAVCAAFVKYDVPEDLAFAASIIEEVKLIFNKQSEVTEVNDPATAI